MFDVRNGFAAQCNPVPSATPRLTQERTQSNPDSRALIRGTQALALASRKYFVSLEFWIVYGVRCADPAFHASRR